MKKLWLKMQVAVFMLFICLLFIINLITPDRGFSSQENRYLADTPKFSFEALFDGRFTSDFERYITDQFFARDSWISMKSYAERAIGKTENNNVFFCKDDTLIERFDKPDIFLLRSNALAISELSEKSHIPVYLALVPGAVEIWQDKLPDNAVNFDQKQLIEEAYSLSGCNTVDIYSQLYSHRDEYIFYRTDHHWTTLGAYYGYRALAEAMELEPMPIEEYQPETVSDEFYGTVYSSSGVRWVEPDKLDVYVPEDGVQTFSYESGVETKSPFYDYSALEEKDKYSFFLGGNTGLLKIKTDLSDAPKLLVIRDSYADCGIPFLTEHFSEIHLIDLRYYKFSLLDYIETNGPDMVLVNYSISTFSSDTNIFLAGR